MARKDKGRTVVPLREEQQVLTSYGRLRRKLEENWKALVVIGAFVSAGWGMHGWFRASLDEIMDRLLRVESVQGEMRDDLRLIKRHLIQP